jgi:hypothetical protein
MADAPLACYRNSVVALLQVTAAACAEQTALASLRNAFAADEQTARSSAGDGDAAEAPQATVPTDDPVPLGAGALEVQ